MLEPGNYVVDRQGLNLFTAILASKIVAVENLPPRQFVAGAGAFNLMLEPDDRGHGHGKLDSVEHTEAVFQHFGFALVAEGDGTPQLANVDWLVILV